MSEQTVAVTGGLGFIGAHLCRALAARGHRVRCIDRLSASYAPGSGHDAWSALASIENVALIRADLGSEPLDAMLDGAHAVVHLAALPGVRAGHERATLWRENVSNTSRLAEEAARRGQRFVLASTSSVYGSSRPLPASEDAVPSPLNAYAVSKLAAERSVLSLAPRGADAVVARLFTVFGPGQRPDMAFARWIHAMLAGRPIEWCARPATVRDFTYVGDAVAGLVAALEHGRAGQVYNIPGGGPASLRDALRVLERLLGRPARVRQIRPSAAEAVATSGCGRKAARELGYRAAISLEEGLERQVSDALGCLTAEAPGDRAAHAARSRPAPAGLLAGPARSPAPSASG